MSNLSRRQFLQSAGGVTLLALIPIGRGLFAATGGSALRALPPLFTALPYVQPGNHSQLIDGEDGVIVTWQTEAKPADFTVQYGPSDRYGAIAKIGQFTALSGNDDDGESRFVYNAPLTGLKLATKYFYRVTCNGSAILAGYFTTRQPRGAQTRFVAFGDNSFGDPSDRNIAFQAYKQNPDFVMNTGDNVYDNGLFGEYERFFFPVYNSDVAESQAGAPLLRTVPFYTVVANHDCHDHDSNKGPAADFTKNADSGGYFLAMNFPLNGPANATPLPLVGDVDAIANFKKGAGERYPRMQNYSFDYGDLHFLCLDSNVYIDPTNTDLQSWITADLSGTDARWKFVIYHHPAFQVGGDHYSEQHMRALAPLLEQHGVDFVLNGHEHTYQRPRPFRFAPKDLANATNLGSKKRYIPGTFTVDRKFDGVTNTEPDGILYIVTGAGGKHLYDPDWNMNPAKWLHPEDNNEDYNVRFVSDRHSLTVFDVHLDTLDMVQIDQYGTPIDRIRVTKRA